MKNVFIIGHYGGDNFGDEAMLAALVYRLNEEKVFDTIKIVSKSKKPLVFKQPNVVWVPNKISEILKAILSTHALILGGGTHFHDDYTDTRYKAHKKYLLRIVVISLIYRLLNRKVLYMGVGYGPFYRKSAKRLTHLSYRLAHQIRVRDDLSLERLSQIGITNNEIIKKAFDLAALHPAYALDEKAVSANGTTLGISVTSLNFSKGKVNDRYWHENVFPAIARWYRTYPDKRIKVFVLRGGERESDFELSKALYDTLAKIDAQRVILVNFTYETQTYIEEIKTCNQFIATRYHSAVLAYLAGCKLLIIPYHEKLIAFAKYIGLSHGAVIIPDDNPDFYKVLDAKDFDISSLLRQQAYTLARENLKVFA